ncbi:MULTISPECIES: type IV toxin-antitoxin system AbiEi family antitoxin domain-containing protein [unclassified Nocardioides]|uniref:type IV toxin-antitoxin system AbiEi family antitoxin domain-containing protein n=1 Tax=unclassified Nocardioides TaxID=2615069 RepID=UPI003014BD86
MLHRPAGEVGAGRPKFRPPSAKNHPQAAPQPGFPQGAARGAYAGRAPGISSAMMIRSDHPMLAPVHLRKELLARGFNDRAIARAVAAGQLQRLRHGSYAGTDSWRQLDDAGRHGLVARAVLRRAGTGAFLSHTSALPFWRIPTWGFDLEVSHLTRTDGKAGRKEAGVRQHRGRVRNGDIEDVHGVPVASVPRALIELTTIGSVEACLCAWNEALHRKLTTAADIEARFVASAENSDPMDHWPGTLKTDLMLHLADGRVETVGESRTFFVCWQHNLPIPTPQYEIRDAFGQVVHRVDFAFPDYGCGWSSTDSSSTPSSSARTRRSVTSSCVRSSVRT